MAHILRTPMNQYQSFIEPLVDWLRAHGVNFQTGTFVRDVGFAASPGRMTANRLDYERNGAAGSATIEPEDLVLLTFGSQGRRHFGRIDDRGATATARRPVLGALAASG
jgi:oleate hydratase